MTEIPVFRIHTERMKKDKFVAIGAHLGLKGDPVATDDALFMSDKGRALAYAMPGSRFAGLLFFTDTTQGVAEESEGRIPGTKVVDSWANAFLKKFRLLPSSSDDKRVRTSFASRVSLRESVTEEGEKATKLRRAPVSAEVAFDVRADDRLVTGPRARLRMTFKTAKRPAWVHRGLWERLEEHERRPLLTEDETYRRLSDQLSDRGVAGRPWRMIRMRLAYFAGEFCGGPDLLQPYYFAEVEFSDPKDDARSRQGPRRLIQLPACP